MPTCAAAWATPAVDAMSGCSGPMPWSGRSSISCWREPRRGSPTGIPRRRRRNEGERSMSERRRRVAIVAPILERHDSISTAALDSFRTLSGRPGWDVSILTNWTNHAASPASIVAGVAGLLKHASFRSADVLLYHFGVYDPLFDALVVGNGSA